MHLSHTRIWRTYHTRPPSNPARNARTYCTLHCDHAKRARMYARELLFSQKIFAYSLFSTLNISVIPVFFIPITSQS